MNYRKIVSDIEDILEDTSNYDQLDDIKSVIAKANEPVEETGEDIEAAKRLQAMLFKRAGKDLPDELKDIEPAGRKKTPKGGFASVDIQWTPEPVTPEMQAEFDEEDKQDKEIRTKDPRVDTSKLHDFIDIKCGHHHVEGVAHKATFRILFEEGSVNMDVNKNITWDAIGGIKTYDDLVEYSKTHNMEGYINDILGDCDACEDECSLTFIHADGTTTNNWTGTDSDYDHDYEMNMFKMKYPEVQFNY